MSANREGCCAQYRKPCSYHEGWEDAEDALDQTTVCPTCGGSGELKVAPGLLSGGWITDPCPDCIRGRQPTPEEGERMTRISWEMMSDIVCPTCHDDPRVVSKNGIPCPTCKGVGCRPSLEVLRRMKKAIHGEYSIGKPRSYADWDRFVLAVWLAEHREDEA